MGYMGLKTWGDSDNAADFVITVEEALGKLCKKELKEKGNTYNTEGAVNIALFAEAFLMNTSIYTGGLLWKAIADARDQLKERVKEFKKEHDWNGKQMHINAYTRMIKSLNKIIKKAY